MLSPPSVKCAKVSINYELSIMNYELFYGIIQDKIQIHSETLPAKLLFLKISISLNPLRKKNKNNTPTRTTI